MDVLVSFLIIIDDICPDRADLSGSAGDPEPACVLSFHYDQQALEVWVDRVKEQTHHRPKLIHGGAWFHAVASKVKDDYSELVADIPDRNLRFGKTLKAFLAFEGKLSLWWLLEVSMKNSEAKTVFNRLCQLYVILDELEGGSYTAIQVYSSDAAFSDVLSRLALRRRLAFISEAGITEAYQLAATDAVRGEDKVVRFCHPCHDGCASVVNRAAFQREDPGCLLHPFPSLLVPSRVGGR